MEFTRRARPPKSTEPTSYDLIETEAASTGPTWVSTSSLHMYQDFEFSNCKRLLGVCVHAYKCVQGQGGSRSLVLVPSLGTIFLLLV